MAGKLNKIGWYWHRLRAMDPGELALRFQKKAYQFSDAKYQNRYQGALEPAGKFPVLQGRESAPQELLTGIRSSVDAILNGDWLAFGHLPLKVDDPPKWQHDYLVARDFQSPKPAFKLDHRAQPGGADIKVIWEPSRWNQLVRLAMGAWLLGDTRAQEKCVEWLHHWCKHNAPFTGLNWTSGLETGIRLIQYTWIDALLAAAGTEHKKLDELRRQILPPHQWYTWRYRSFGSSANNHLIGELAGLIIALARWPELAKISGSLADVAKLWEAEVLAQFAEDGGNKEQAIGYHLFSWEFCWQAQEALEVNGVAVSAQVKERLRLAARFYVDAKPEGDVWDFGDCDNAWVTPLFADERQVGAEWWRWFSASESSTALRYWWGDFAAPVERRLRGWRVYDASGLAIYEGDGWFIRFDFSPLGYLSIAPHGHLDALHVSIWREGRPIIVDPGTGAYYADKIVRDYLADWAAHNSPHLKTPPEAFPRRAGTFLWAQHHSVPRFKRASDEVVEAEISLPYGTASRRVTVQDGRISIIDAFGSGANAVVATRWKFAPALHIRQATQGHFVITDTATPQTGPVNFQFSGGWKMARSYNPPEELRLKRAPTAAALGSVPLQSIVSPAFRSVACAPYLILESSEPGPFEVALSAG